MQMNPAEVSQEMSETNERYTVDLDLLKQEQIFKGLTDDELLQVQCCCKEILLEGDTLIFKENDPADYLYTLIDGKVSIRYKLPCLRTVTEHTIASIEPGGTFGWSSLSPSACYRFSAYCEESTHALRCNRESLVAVLESNHTIGYKVMKNLALVVGTRFVALQNEIARRDGQDFIDGW